MNGQNIRDIADHRPQFLYLRVKYNLRRRKKEEEEGKGGGEREEEEDICLNFEIQTTKRISDS